MHVLAGMNPASLGFLIPEARLPNVDLPASVSA